MDKIKFQKNVSLATVSTFKIGGKAREFILAKNSDELVRIIKQLEIERSSYKIFAGGSNVVFPDEGLDCVVVRVLGGKIEVYDNKIIADAGVPLIDVIKKSVFLGLQGLEKLSGIPGTIGGAVVGNAGAYGHSISEIINKVEIFDGKKKRFITKGACNFAYRHSLFKEKKYIILRVFLRFKKGNAKELLKIYKDTILMREKKYKPGLRCAGSFFKNIPVQEVNKKTFTLIDQSKIISGKIPVGYLLEEVGAKGMRVNGIKISDFHCNIFINDGGGKAKDVKELAEILRKRVIERFGIGLEEEVRFL